MTRNPLWFPTPSTEEIETMTKLTNTGLKVGKLALYVNNAAQTYRLGSKGTSENIGHLFGSMSKGEARKLRKALHAKGFGNAVRVSRINPEPVPARIAA